MLQRDEAWLSYQQRRWLRPDGDRWVRPDAARFLAPGSNVLDAFPPLAFKYNPNQPRVPAGYPDGGQWTNGWGGSAISAKPSGDVRSSAALPMGSVPIADAARESANLFSLAPKEPDRTGIRLAGDLPEGSDPSPSTGDERPPEVPDKLPETPEGRNRLMRAAITWVARVGRHAPIVDVLFGAIDQLDQTNKLSAAIRSANDPRRSLAELQYRATLPTEDGYQNHHVVGQFEGNRKQFGNARIDEGSNIVRIPVVRHRDISNWYSTKNPEFGNVSPRDYLRGKSWDEQRELGLMVLRKFRVLD
jgi:hypothetical protein